MCPRALERERESHARDLGLPFQKKVPEAKTHTQVEYRLALDEDLYLADHCLVDAANGLKPLSARVALLPMTMGVEMMAEAGSSLVPGLELIGIEEVRASRWIALQDVDSLALEIAARRQPNDPERQQAIRVDAEVRTSGEAQPAITGTICFGGRYGRGPDFSNGRLEGAEPCGIDARDIYASRRLFHGPSFQCLSGEPRLSPEGVQGEIRMPSGAGLFHSTPAPRLLAHPVVFDGVGQLLGVWAMQRGLAIFPVGFKQLELYAPPPPPGTLLPVRIQVTGSDWKLLRARVEIQDGSGRVWARIDDWSHWVFRWPQRVLDFRRRPARYPLSQELPAAVLPKEAVGRWLSTTDLVDDEFDVAARLCLHADEMPSFLELEDTQAKSAWLAERIVAKDSTRCWLRDREGGEMRLPASFSLDRVGTIASSPELSVGWLGDRVFAVAHRCPAGIGLASSRTTAARESAAKLAGIESAEEATEIQILDEGNAADTLRLAVRGREVDVRCSCHDDFWLAIAHWREPTPDPAQTLLEHVAY